MCPKFASIAVCERPSQCTHTTPVCPPFFGQNRHGSHSSPKIPFARQKDPVRASNNTIIAAPRPKSSGLEAGRCKGLANIRASLHHCTVSSGVNLSSVHNPFYHLVLRHCCHLQCHTIWWVQLATSAPHFVCRAATRYDDRVWKELCCTKFNTPRHACLRDPELTWRALYRCAPGCLCAGPQVRVLCMHSLHAVLLGVWQSFRHDFGAVLSTPAHMLSSGVHCCTGINTGCSMTSLSTGGPTS